VEGKGEREERKRESTNQNHNDIDLLQKITQQLEIMSGRTRGWRRRQKEKEQTTQASGSEKKLRAART
jgi:hypothetical protein